DSAIKIFVRKSTIAGGNDCVYTFDPAGTTTLADYPHIAVSNNYLYLAFQRLNTQGTTSTSDDTWMGSSVVRYSAANLSNCVSPPASSTFTKTTGGQRIFVPVENATTV